MPPIPYEKRKEYFKTYRKKNPEKAKQASEKWREENQDQERLRKRKWRMDNLDRELEKQAKKNAEAGHKPRSKAHTSTVTVKVPQTRRFVIIGQKAYFNRENGYDAEELSRILSSLHSVQNRGTPKKSKGDSKGTLRKKPTA